MFKIGDTVIHPRHGICTVESMQNYELSDIREQVFVLKPNRATPGNLRILVPKEKIKTSGVHYPVKRSEIASVLNVLERTPQDLSKECEQGYSLSKEKIQSGNLYKAAQAVRDLENQKERKLNSIKEQLLQSPKKMLIEEIAYVKHLTKNEAEELIDESLEKKERMERKK